jgi:TPR repeat protein
MCFDAPDYLASRNIVRHLKQSDPDLETLLKRAKADDGDALFVGSFILLGGFDLAPIDEIESVEWAHRGALAKHPACAVAYGIHVHSGYVTGRTRDADRYVVLGKKWLLDATRDQTQPWALVMRGVVEEYGVGGFRRSRLNARKLFAAAAEMGDPFGQFRLAQQLEQESSRTGRYDDQNAATAFRLVQLAAEQGFAAAQRMLSVYLQSGFGTEKDEDAATAWLFKAAHQHHPMAALEAGYWCSSRSRQAEPNSDQANKSLGDMFNWYQIAGRSGLSMAAIALAYCYESGSGVEKNKAVAYSMYHELAHRDGRSFATRLPNQEGMNHIKRRMAALRAETTSTEREGNRTRMVWGEDEIIITEAAEPIRRKA